VTHLRILVTLAVLSTLMPDETFAQTGPSARLTVEVTNNTANGATVAGDEVTLLLYKGQEQIDTLQAQAGADGKAVFENVPAGPGLAAVPRAKHQNMVFNGPPVSLDPTAGEFSANVPVFDVSTDTSKLSVGVHHIMISINAASLEFTEYMQLSNASDRAVTGAEKDERNRPIVIEIKLPKGFKDLTASGYLEQEALVVTKDGFYDTLAMPPGEHQVTFSYKVDIDRGTVNITQEVSLPTSELVIFWERGQGRLEGLGEPADRLVNAEGVPLEYYRRSALKPGDQIAFQISGFHVKQSDAYTWITLAAVFVVVVVVALLRLRPRPTESGRQHA